MGLLGMPPAGLMSLGFRVAVARSAAQKPAVGSKERAAGMLRVLDAPELECF